MIIHTAKCTLRTFQESDIDEFYLMVNDEEIQKYVKYIYCMNHHDARSAVLDYMNGDCKNDFYLLIEKDGILVGCIVAVKINDFTLDLSACVREGYRGKGIMVEALNAFFEWLKVNTEYTSLDAIVSIYNESSLRMVEKIDGAYCYRQKNDNSHYRIEL